MSPAEYRQIIDRLGLTQSWIGETLSTNRSTGRRWATGGARIPKSAAIVLRAIDSGLLTSDEVVKLAAGMRPRQRA